MRKQTVTKIAVDANLQDGRQAAGHVVDSARQHDADAIDGNEQPQRVQRAALYEMVKCIPLEQGQGDIHQAGEYTAGQHQKDRGAVFFYVRQNASDAKERQMGRRCTLVFHTDATSSLSVEASASSRE